MVKMLRAAAANGRDWGEPVLGWRVAVETPAGVFYLQADATDAVTLSCHDSKLQITPLGTNCIHIKAEHWYEGQVSLVPF